MDTPRQGAGITHYIDFPCKHGMSGNNTSVWMTWITWDGDNSGNEVHLNTDHPPILLYIDTCANRRKVYPGSDRPRMSVSDDSTGPHKILLYTLVAILSV